MITKHNRRQVTYCEAEEFAREHDVIYIETSAKTGHNIEKLFRISSHAIMEKINKNLINLENEVITY